MKLYLVRHGEAKSEYEDPERRLTEPGRRDVQRLATRLERLKLPVGAVWHSGKARAQETAQIMHGAVVCPAEPMVHAGLGPDDPPDVVQAEIERSEPSLMIVGHLPFLARLASLLLVGWTEGVTVDFQPGGVVCLERPRPGQKWQVLWSVAPALFQ
jgi:phosphohistidine phosphatase